MRTTPQSPFSEEQQEEIAQECDTVAAVLKETVGKVSEGCTALGAAMGLMRLASEMLYHADDASIADVGSIAMMTMQQVCESHGASEEPAESDAVSEPPTVDEILASVHGSELFDMEKLAYNIDMSCAFVFDGVPVTFQLNADPGFFAQVNTEAAQARFDLGFDPHRGRPQISWQGGVPANPVIRKATYTLVATFFALHQHGQLIPFFKKENA